jgi:hypothetical protein
MTLARVPGAGSNIVISSLYTVFLCFEWPLPIFGAFLAGLVLRDSRGASRIAWAAVALVVLTVAGVIAALIIIANNH